jgi:hypothetical protein
MLTIPENAQWALALNPATDAAGRTSSYFSLKDVVGKAYVRVDITQGNAATVAITLNQATTVAGGSAKALSATTRVWATEDVATAATVLPARVADAASTYTTGAGTTNKSVIIEVDPATMDVAGGFDCIAVTTGASNVANITTASIFIPSKYAQYTQRSPRTN